MARPRQILHVDMDAFFVSVELRRRPELVGQPVVVGGTGPRGVVAAASYEARRFGVYSAMPSAIARRRCAHAVFLPGDHALYGEVSADVRAILDRYTPLVEPLSLDEAFLDVTGSIGLFGPAPTIAASIRHDIRTELALDCSVGVAPNKFLAKLASVEAKPKVTPTGIVLGAGVTVVDPERITAFLDPLPVERIWGVGPATLEKLHRIGIKRVAELRAIDPAALSTTLGPTQATHLAALARGLDDRPVEPDREAKSISHEETFASNVHDAMEVRRHAVRLSDAVAQRLRHSNVAARTVMLKIRFDDGFRTITRSMTVSDPVDTGPAILEALTPLLDDIDPSPGIRLIGVAGSNLTEPTAQLSLFDETRDRGTALAVDAIRERFGMSSIGPASNVERGRVRTAGTGVQQWGPTTNDSEERPRGDRNAG